MVFRAGEQEQTPPEGFESSGSETVLGTEVKYDTPITRTITSANIDRLRFTFGVQALVETTSKGDRNPSEVRLLVQIQRNGGWVTEKTSPLKAKPPRSIWPRWWWITCRRARLISGCAG